jgi:hypothetical protein
LSLLYFVIARKITIWKQSLIVGYVKRYYVLKIASLMSTFARNDEGAWWGAFSVILFVVINTSQINRESHEDRNVRVVLSF